MSSPSSCLLNLLPATTKKEKSNHESQERLNPKVRISTRILLRDVMVVLFSDICFTEQNLCPCFEFANGCCHLDQSPSLVYSQQEVFSYLAPLPQPRLNFITQMLPYLGRALSIILWNSGLWNYSLSVQFSSVTQLCPTLCDTRDCSTPGFPVHHQLQELAQICHPLFLLPSNFLSIRVFSKESVLHYGQIKILPKYIAEKRTGIKVKIKTGLIQQRKYNK